MTQTTWHQAYMALQEKDVDQLTQEGRARRRVAHTWGCRNFQISGRLRMRGVKLGERTN